MGSLFSIIGNSFFSPNHGTDMREIEPQQTSNECTALPSLPPATICAETKGGILSSIGWIKSGCFNINTLPNKIKTLNAKNNRLSTEHPQAFPTILELAQLSKHAYAVSDFNDETEVPFVIEHMTDWICIGTGRYSDGYCGAAYVNYKHSHVVIAHGGTEFKKEFYRDFIITDVGGVVLNKEVSQISSAYIFTKLIVNLCSDTQFSISVTGHSLGGWLAQISAFYIGHPNYICQNKETKKIIEDKNRNLGLTNYVEINKPNHLHTVSFDSPGSRRALKKIVGYYGSKMIEWREKVDTLDFTVIVAPSNVVNTWGEHVGYVLALEMSGVTEVSRGSASHGIQLFVKHLSSQEPKLKVVHDVYWGKAIQKADEHIILDQWFLGRTDSCQVNVLSPREIKFLTRAQIIIKWRNNVSMKSSDMSIFGQDKYMKARTILNDINDKELKDFVENFTVKNNAINFPEKILKEKEMNMSELIWKLIKWFRLKRDWLNGRAFKDVIRDLPRCREMVCESEGSLYIKRLPGLNDRQCTTQGLCAQVSSFLGNELEHFLPIKARRDGRQSRLYVVHIFNCFRDYYKNEVGEHKLFINISIVQRLNLEIKMAEIFSQTKFSLIVVECDSEMNEVMNEVITGMIANVSSAKKKLIIVTCGDNCPPINDYAPLECKVDPTLQFENLDELSQKVISQCHVEMHGDTIILGKSGPHFGSYLLEDVGTFLNSENSGYICDIFDGKIIDLSGGTLPIMADHYMTRTLFNITLDVGKVTRNVEKFSDVIVISNCDTSIKILFPELIHLFNKDLIYEPPVYEYTKISFLDDCAVNEKLMFRNVHWFKVEKVNEESMLVWQMSNGQPCFDYLLDDEGGIPDSDLHELKNNFIILSDEPGMGKSSAITKLFLEYRNRQFSSTNSHFNWPIYINLNNHQVELKNTSYSSDSAISLLTKASNLKGDFEKIIFKYCLEEIGNVTFFIDSFDEISQKGQDFVVQMLQHLRNMQHSKISVWIATRNYAKFELEKSLGTKSYRFHRIGRFDQIKFLANYWTNCETCELWNNDKVIEFRLAQIFAELVIIEIQKVLGTDHTFIGIPLQLVLLALVYIDSFLQLLEKQMRLVVKEIPLSLSDDGWEDTFHKFSSTLELYDSFIDKKMNIWLEDKFQFQTRSDWMDHRLRADMNEIHSQAAFLYMSSSILTNSDINIQQLSPKDSQEVNRVGFCEMYESNFRFYHQTIAEYFTAKYLEILIRRNHSNNVVSFLKNHYHQQYFNKIRYFLDSLLCTDIPGLGNLELLDTRGDSVKTQSLRERFTNRIWRGVDALGRNILHYAMAYGDHDSGIFWIIEKDLSLFHRKDLLGESCLSYSCLSDNFLKSACSYDMENLDYSMPGGKFFATKYEDLIRQLKWPVLYYIFCGRRLKIWLENCVENDGTIYSPPEEVFQYLKSLNSMQNKDKNLLTQNVEINMAWLTRCTVNRVSDFLARLCLHNSLGMNPILFLEGWLNDCLGDDDGDESIHELGAELIRVCRHKQYDCVLEILRDNLIKYYHNALPYMRGDEYDLWKSLGKDDKRKMLYVMRNHNFYSLFRVPLGADLDFLEEVIRFVKLEGDEFKDGLIRGLVIAFDAPILAEMSKIAFDIFCDGDDNAKTQIIKENDHFKMCSTNPELFLHNVGTSKHKIDRLWTTEGDIQAIPRKFFRLPVRAVYESC